MTSEPRIVVCVPARNEAERLPICLAAFAAQTMPATVVIALNNTTDHSMDMIDRFRHRHRSLDIVVDDVTFALERAHAGSARRRAMDVGAEVAGSFGLVVSTDADTRPPPHWIASNVAALRQGLNIVGGQIRPDEHEAVSPALRATLAATARYWAEVRAIEDAIDPIAWDPPPRHGDHTGASLALSVADYRLSGGVPPLASGEDRALVRAVCRTGGKLGHPPDVWTRVSARTIGRAQYGMAQEMAKLLEAVSQGAAVRLPAFEHWRTRAEWRRIIRARFGEAEVVAREDALPPMPCDFSVMPDVAAA